MKIESTETRLVELNGNLYQIHKNGFALDSKGKRVGYKTDTGYVKIAGDFLLHRVIYKEFTDWTKRGTPKGINCEYWKTLSVERRKDFHDMYECVDHIDGNNKNNKFKNLQGMPYRENSKKGNKAA